MPPPIPSPVPPGSLVGSSSAVGPAPAGHTPSGIGRALGPARGRGYEAERAALRPPGPLGPAAPSGPELATGPAAHVDDAAPEACTDADHALLTNEPEAAPQVRALIELAEEGALFDCAAQLMVWLGAHADALREVPGTGEGSPGGGLLGLLFSTDQLMAHGVDALIPRFTTILAKARETALQGLGKTMLVGAADYQKSLTRGRNAASLLGSVVGLLEDRGVVRAKGTGYEVVREGFDEKDQEHQAALGTFTRAMNGKATSKGERVFATSVLTRTDLMAGAQSEHERLGSKVTPPPAEPGKAARPLKGSEGWKRLKAMPPAEQAAEIERIRRESPTAAAPWAFAKEVTEFLMTFADRLENAPRVDGCAKTPGFVAGTYGSHGTGEFSADLYLKGGGSDNGFWAPDRVKQFLMALDSHAAAGVTLDEKPVRFDWRAAYNDPRVISDPALPGGRIHFGFGHGPKGIAEIPLADLRAVTSVTAVDFAAKTCEVKGYGRMALAGTESAPIVRLDSLGKVMHIHLDIAPKDLATENAGYRRAGRRIELLEGATK